MSHKQNNIIHIMQIYINIIIILL